MKNKLYIFAGKPGAGKSSIIKELFPNEKIIDVLSFLEKFEANGIIPEEKTLTGYEDMYQHIAKNGDHLNVMELGTNHPEFNIIELEKLKNSFNIKIFLCDASREICLKRAMQRGMRHTKEAFERRMNRDFPNTFIKLLKKTSLNYQVVDMEKSFDEQVNWFKKEIGS